jgi:predicted nucleic acid-binding protein
MTLVDTNVLLDIATDNPRWARWSLRQLDAAAMRGPVLINAIVYALATRVLRMLIVCLPALGLNSERFHAPRYFSPARCISVTALKVVAAPECCPIFSSAPMQLWRNCLC